MVKLSTKMVLGCAGGLALTALVLLILNDTPQAQIAAFILLWIWPAFTWAVYLRGPAVERILIAAGLSILLVALLVLIVSYLPGEVNFAPLLIGQFLIVMAPLVASWKRGGSYPIKFNDVVRSWLPVVAVMLIAILLRATNLGYKELQGDEGVIMVRAASILTGDEAELFLHQKGPAEILLPAGTWALTGTIDDYWARLVFTWAGVLEVAAIYWLARCWFGRKAAISAALLFAVGGFGIAFSRIIQYQALVMLWGTLALISATRYRNNGRTQDLLLTSAFAAAGLLAHYDAVLILPAVIWVVSGRIRRGEGLNRPALYGSILLVLIIVGIFYIPFAFSPNASRTFQYIVSDRLTVSDDTSFFGWSGPAVWQMMTFYNSIWYVIGIVILSSVGLIGSIKKRREIAAGLYLLVPLLFYLIVVGDPRTHVYTVFPGAAILAGFGTSEIWNSVEEYGNSYLQFAVLVMATIWSVLVIAYPYLMFVDISKERQRTWVDNRPWPAFYPVTWDEPPEYGLFGFPHQTGWRAALAFLPDTAFPYASNEEQEITNWYMAQAPRTHCKNANSVLVTTNSQDEVVLDQDWLAEFHLRDLITISDEGTLSIYGRDAVDEVEVIDGSEYERWLTPEEVVPPALTGTYTVNITLEDQVRLLGYDLETDDSRPGGEVTVTLYWEVLQPFAQNKQVFVHLFDGNIIAQHDGAPECAINPTTRWEPGQIVVDPHTVSLPEDVDLGMYPLLVGMYDLITRDRMLVHNGMEDFIYLTDVDINAR